MANVIFNNSIEGGTQSGYAVGMDFTVNSAVTVTALGTFDAGLTAFPATPTPNSADIAQTLLNAISSGNIPVITVGIYNVATGVEVSPTATFDYNDALLGAYYAIKGSIFLNIPALTLAPGQYSIVAAGYNEYLYFGNMTSVSPAPPPTAPTFDTLLGALTLSGDARINGTGFGIPPLAFPTDYSTPESSPDFLAGTFIATASAPDGGSTLALLGMALGAAACLRRKLVR